MDTRLQLESMGQLGSFDKLLDMVPGMGGVKDKVSSKDLKTQENKLGHWKSAISSMTEDEIENPELFDKETSRIQRVAKGSGTTTSEIRELLKQYKMLNEMMGSQSAFSDGNIDQKTIQKLAKKFGKKMRM